MDLAFRQRMNVSTCTTGGLAITSPPTATRPNWAKSAAGNSPPPRPCPKYLHALFTATNPMSIAQNREYARLISKNPSGTFGFLSPVCGDAMASHYPSPDQQPTAPGTSIVANYHAHAALDPTLVTQAGDSIEFFSAYDKYTNRVLGIPGFLGTPKHTIKKYDPTLDRVIVKVPGANGGGGQP